MLDLLLGLLLEEARSGSHEAALRVSDDHGLSLQQVRGTGGAQ